MSDISGSSRGLLCYSEESNSPASKSSPQQDPFEEENSNEEKRNNSKKSERKRKFNSLVQKFPPVAVQEKIIFCIDNSVDVSAGYSVENCSPQSNYSAGVRNEAISLFISNKLAIASHTEFGIISIEPGAVKWLSLLNSDISHSLKALSEMKPVGSDELTNSDITPIFECVFREVSIPEFNPSTVKFVPPSYIIRVILVFGNSFEEPQLNFEDPSYTKFIRSPCCFLDVIYLHEKVNDSNSVCEIFKTFGKIVSSDSYLLECSRDVVWMFNSMAKLMAHPLQRVEQEKWPF